MSAYGFISPSLSFRIALWYCHKNYDEQILRNLLVRAAKWPGFKSGLRDRISENEISEMRAKRAEDHKRGHGNHPYIARRLWTGRSTCRLSGGPFGTVCNVASRLRDEAK